MYGINCHRQVHVRTYVTWKVKLFRQGPTKMVDLSKKERPLGTKMMEGLGSWHAESHAILNAPVSSVMPSPTAP